MQENSYVLTGEQFSENNIVLEQADYDYYLEQDKNTEARIIEQVKKNAGEDENYVDN